MPLELSPFLLDVVRCPQCHGSLAIDEPREALNCEACRLAFPTRAGIPLLLLDEAKPLEPVTPCPTP